MQKVNNGYKPMQEKLRLRRTNYRDGSYKRITSNP